MTTFRQRAAHLLAAAGFTAGLCTGLGYAAAASAETPPTAPAHEALEQRFAMHIQSHLDQLAARLEIKASQESAWQAFSASFRELMTPTHRDGNQDAIGTRPMDLDAAALAHEHAERAAERAQKLARLAEATSKLQQVLSNDQRQVLNEAARRFAHQHFGHQGMAHGDFHGRGGENRDHGEDGRYPGGAGPRDRWEGGDARDGAPR